MRLVWYAVIVERNGEIGIVATVFDGSGTGRDDGLERCGLWGVCMAVVS